MSEVIHGVTVQWTAFLTDEQRENALALLRKDPSIELISNRAAVVKPGFVVGRIMIR
jgi:hypothetical protein